MQTYRIKIGGMGCEHCLHAVRKALESLEKVHVVEVTMGSAVAAFEDEVPAGAVREAIEEAGYELLELERM